MNYDKRIKDYHDIRCFASRNNRECLGKFGYFAEDISELKNLDDCVKGICCFKDGEDFPFYVFEKNKEPTYPKKAYPIFCPASITKGKSYRPYTLNEFLDKYTVCANIRIRQRDRTCQYFGKLIGYEFPTDPNTGEQKGDNDAIVCIGGYNFKLTELFTDYEQYDNMKDIWVPCGVEVKE